MYFESALIDPKRIIVYFIYFDNNLKTDIYQVLIYVVIA